MHNDMTFDLTQVQGQSQGDGPLEIRFSTIFKVYLLRYLSCELENVYSSFN